MEPPERRIQVAPLASEYWISSACHVRVATGRGRKSVTFLLHKRMLGADGEIGDACGSDDAVDHRLRSSGWAGATARCWRSRRALGPRRVVQDNAKTTRRIR